MAQSAKLRAREISTRVDRLTGGAAGRVYRAGKWVAIHLVRLATEPRYVIGEARLHRQRRMTSQVRCAQAPALAR